MRIDEFIKKNSSFNKHSENYIFEWNGYKVYNVWAEYNGMPTPTGQPIYILEDINGSYRFTEVDEAIQILKIEQRKL